MEQAIRDYGAVAVVAQYHGGEATAAPVLHSLLFGLPGLSRVAEGVVALSVAVAVSCLVQSSNSLYPTQWATGSTKRGVYLA